VLQSVAACWSVLQCVIASAPRNLESVAMCCSVLQCVAVCCSVLQCVAVSPSSSRLAHVASAPRNMGRAIVLAHLDSVVNMIV